jgi:hypothetical protein
VTYAAAVSKGLHERTCIVTASASPEDAAALAGHNAHIIPSDATLTFQHTYTLFGNHRKLKVLRHPSHTLSARDVPLRCRMARTVLIAPLTQTDVDAKSLTQPENPFFRTLLLFQRVGLLAQGHQRRLDDQGNVKHLTEPSSVLLDSLTTRATLFLSDVETDPWNDEQFAGVVERSRMLVVTRGAKGVSLYRRNVQDVHVPAKKIKAVDTNGAGDTFATAFMLSSSRGYSTDHALMRATWMASRVCLRPQACKPDCCTDAVQEVDPQTAQPKPQHAKPEIFAEKPSLPDEEPQDGQV